jgi:Flp pilus assembly protein TadG
MAGRRSRRGQATLEFVLAYAGVLLPATFALFYTSQLLWVWHSVAIFTREGARYATTHCWQVSSGNVVQFMKANVPLTIDRDQFQNGPVQITVSYFSKDPDSGQLVPFTCDTECSTLCIPDSVTVSVTGYEFRTFVTALGLPPVAIPDFRTSLTIESAGCDPEQGACLP